MDHVLRHVSVEPGDNVVARFGNAAGVFSTRTDAEADRVEGLIEALETAGQATPLPGEDLVRRLAPLVLENAADFPSFGLVAAIDKGFVVLLRGSAWAHLTNDDTTLHLAGDTALTWVDRIVTGNYSSIALTLTSGGPRPANPRSDLRLGSVSGNGLVVHSRAIPLSYKATPAAAPAPAPAPAPKPAPAPAPRPAPEPELEATQAQAPVKAQAPRPAPKAETTGSKSMFRREPKRAPSRAPQTDTDLEATQAAPAAKKEEPTTAPTPTMASLADLEETMASAAAFTLDDETQAAKVVSEDTVDSAPAKGGAAPAEATQLASAFTAQPSPVLVGADGSRIFLDRNYVFGRDPRTDPAVRRGEASAITIPDNSDAVSRVHAYVNAAKGAITIRDNDSTNGTFVAAPGAQQWVKVGKEPAEIFLGWAICLGNRVYVLQAPDADQAK